MEKKLNKILIHINSLGKGGAERVASMLASYFALDGIETVVATTWQEEEEHEVHEAVRRVHAGLSEKEESYGRIRKLWLRTANLRKVVKKERPDLILSFCVKANYRAIQAALGTGIPVVVSVRNDPKVDYVGKAKHIMNHLFLNKACGCVFQTEEARDFFDETLQKKSRIISNPVNDKYLQAKRKMPKTKIVFVGRLVEQKNPFLLVHAFEDLREKYPSYELYLYGDNFEDECKNNLIAYLNQPSKEEVKKNIHFMGISNCLEEEMADAAMFVLPSDYEGMPNALMEAMAMGLPVISTDCPCGGSRYWINHKENGLLVPVGDKKAMTKAMEYYIEHPLEAAKMGERAKERLREAEADNVYRQWKCYLEEVLNGKAAF